PPPLRLVQSFVNTVDLEHRREWLDDPSALAAWAHERRLVPRGTKFTRSELRRALELREAFRSLLAANRDRTRDAAALDVVTRAARSGELTVAFDADGAPTLEPAARGFDGLTGRLAGVAVTAVLDGS